MNRPDYAPPVWREDRLSRWLYTRPWRVAAWLIVWLVLSDALTAVAFITGEWIWGIVVGLGALIPVYQAIVYLPRTIRAAKENLIR